MSESAALRTLPRSFLYVPGDRLDLVEKAAGGEADAVLLDLEDAVAPESRAGARATVATWLASAPHGTPQWWV
ncbi:MAG: aldolase/citrate lyase family protein, partial [Ornithinimicrobium sp.]